MGQYLHKFNMESAFNTAYNGEAYHEPWVSYTDETEGQEHVDYNKKVAVTEFTIDMGAEEGEQITIHSLGVACGDLDPANSGNTYPAISHFVNWEGYADTTIEGWFSFGDYWQDWEFHCEDEEEKTPYCYAFPHMDCSDGEIYMHIPS